MKFTCGFLAVVIAFILGLAACNDTPDFSPTPEIEFENLIFKETPSASEADSLILFIKFKDGDGNLGLSPNDVGCQIIAGDTICYNEKFFFISTIDGSLLNFEDKRLNPALNLPDFVKPFNCINWQIVRDADGVVQDTVFFRLNENHFNIFVEYLVKQDDGSFELFDWRTEFNFPNCGISFDGRFPILAKNGDLSQSSPLEGTLRYGMGSTGFKILFSIKTLKLRVQIQDRLLNRSNIIETPEFQFN